MRNDLLGDENYPQQQNFWTTSGMSMQKKLNEDASMTLLSVFLDPKHP
jgi:hypothetical protein